MRLSGFGWARSMNIPVRLCLCLVLIGLITAGAIAYTNRSCTASMLPGVQACQAEPLQQNEAGYAPSAIGGVGPVIQVFKADPTELDTPGSAAIYTFKVKRATKVQLIEAGNTVKDIDNPTGATLNGTANGLPASAIPADDSGKFIAVLMASNDAGIVKEELTLSLAADLIPASQAGATDNQTGQRTPQWLEQFSAPRTSTPAAPSTTPRNEPDFFECPENCQYCLKPGEAASHGFTNKCSDQRCYFSPDDQQNWYCYSEPEGWCCADGRVFQNKKSECTRIGGFWSISQGEALHRCEPEGWCCKDGQLYYPATQPECDRIGGDWYATQARARELCQPMCYCCLRNQVFQTTQNQCAQSGGTCYDSLSRAMENCQPRTCWCCLNSQVYQATQTQCTQSGGTCYTSQSEAQANCRINWR